MGGRGVMNTDCTAQPETVHATSVLYFTYLGIFLFVYSFLVEIRGKSRFFTYFRAKLQDFAADRFLLFSKPNKKH